MTDILFIIIFIPVLIAGLKHPVIAICAYLWLDLSMPTFKMYGLARDIPWSLITAFICLISVFINSKKISFPKTIETVLIAIFLLWITLSTYNAIFETLAWKKWDWAFKSILFTYLLAFLPPKKENVELIILTVLVSVFFFTFSLGPKAILGGVGYGRNLITGQVNFGLYESSTLAAFSASTIPFIFFLKKHSILLPKFLLHQSFIYGCFLVTIASIIGTFARTGVLCLVYLTFHYILKSKRKLRNIILILLFTPVALLLAPQEWTDRISTISTHDEDSSASGRVAVWKWTIQFVKDKPLGGGFDSFFANIGELNEFSRDDFDFSKAKAFHSIYFEVLGEQGYFGLLLYLLIIGFTLLKLRGLSKCTHCEEWVTDLSSVLFFSLTTLLVGGLFVGIAYRPYIFIFISLSIILNKSIKKNAQ
jgi:putative inorganic carbon (HCO3(-)) transporter